MNQSLTLHHASYYLAQLVDNLAAKQILAAGHLHRGGLVNPVYDMADPKLTGDFVVALVYHLLAAERLGAQVQRAQAGELLDRANLAAAYLLRAQRPSGLIDLISVNYDSSPDTAFTMQQLCTLFELAGERSRAHPGWAELLARLEQFIRRAVDGILVGGFHTPNHRWVIVSALAQARICFPDLAVEDVVGAYLAEGFDVDVEGAYSERSVGVYDAVNNRSLLFIAEHWNRPDAVEVVARNLNFDLHLLHADGSAETGLSRRQDYGTREVVSGLIPILLLCHRVHPDPVLAEAAHRLWSLCLDPTQHILWLTYALLRCGDTPSTGAELPEDFDRYYPLNGIWRVRRDLLSATLFARATRLLTFMYGAAELSSLKISQTYFGRYTGRFVGDTLDVVGGRAILRSEGTSNPRRPGYELPLGRPVPPTEWDEALVQRGLRRLPPAVSTLTAIEAVDQHGRGFDLHYRTLDGLDGVAAQVALDFAPGGVWETADTRLQPRAGQVLFLKEGHGRMRYGDDVIEVGPGAYAHGMWQMREAESAPEHVRVLLTLLTPVDWRLRLRAFRGLEP